MQRRTTTQKLYQAITNNLLQLVKAECHYKSSDRIDEISVEKFKNDFDFLCESGCFMECIGWNYEKDYKSGRYIVETGRLNPHSDVIVTAYLNVAKNVNDKEIEEALLFSEE